MNNETLWSVRVTLRDTELNDARAEVILQALADLKPAIFPGDGSAADAVVVHPTEATLRQAIATGLRRVEDATGERACGVEAMTHEDLVASLAVPSVPALVGHADIAELLGVSRQRAAQLAERPDFPPAVMTIKAGPLRVRSQVEGWAQTWARKTGRPAAVPATT